MTLRTGSYNAKRPEWRGIIRNDGLAWYRCTHHDHERPADAKECARQALPQIRERDHQDPAAPMPPDWEVFPR